MPKLLRITTVPISLKLLLTGQMSYMAQNGYEVLMVSADGKERKELIVKENCPHFIIPFTRKISPLRDLKCLLQLVRLIKKHQPDIVHTHTPKAGLLGMIAARICSVPLRLHTIAGLPYMTASGLTKSILKFTERLTAWGAHKVLPNSKSMLQFIQDYNMVPLRKLQMVGYGSSNGIDLHRFSKKAIFPEKLERIKESLSFDPKNIYIIAIGRVVKDKGINELVSAFLTTLNKYENIRLLIIGPFEDERNEEALQESVVKEIKNNSNIHHINWSDDVEYYMFLANVLVHASHREGFPNVVLQAAAMECPIICSDIPGNIDIVQDNHTGLQFNVGKQSQLEKKMLFALENPGVIKKYASFLRTEVEKKYSRQYFHSELLRLYKSSLNG